MSTDRKKKKRYKIRNMNIDRADLVDRGANQDAVILYSKRDDNPVADVLNRYAKHAGPTHPSGSGQDVHGDRAASKRKRRQDPPRKKSVRERTRERYESGEGIKVGAKPYEGPKTRGGKSQLSRDIAETKARLEAAGTVASDPVKSKNKTGIPEQFGRGRSRGKPLSPLERQMARERSKRRKGQRSVTELDSRYRKSTPGRARALRALARTKAKNKRRIAEGKKPIVEGKEVSPETLKESDTQ